ncbi:MAG: anhydro-N-acetylmuramic acid kinase [Chitinophagaceae bacterium]
MNKQIEKLYSTAQKKSRRIIGLMSGTSLDGLDIAVCKLNGFGKDTNIEIEFFTTVNYDASFKSQVKEIFSKKSVDLEKVCLMNEWIGIEHGKMINAALLNWGIKNSDIDVIASHGQTIYHAPKWMHQQSHFNNATLQIGDGDHLAVTTGIITISDFRQKHIAAGGEGAPLAVYGDYLIFSSKEENRIMLNMGGIANFTYLPPSLDAKEVYSTDVGTGNTLMDAYVQKYFEGYYFDENAFLASQGTIQENLLNELMNHSFFEQDFPKTTGPELFNLDYLLDAQEKSNTQNLNHYDVMATLNAFSATAIADALRRCLIPNEKPNAIYASGGGMHNPLLMHQLKVNFPEITFKTTKDLHIQPDAKEAVLFAVLANETLAGEGLSIGKNTIDIPAVCMGKISFPG